MAGNDILLILIDNFCEDLTLETWKEILAFKVNVL